MRVLRTIVDHILRDGAHNSQIREICKTQDIIRWIRQRRRNLNQHVSRMIGDRIAKRIRERNVVSEDSPANRLNDGKTVGYKHCKKHPNSD